MLKYATAITDEIESLQEYICGRESELEKLNARKAKLATFLRALNNKKSAGKSLKPLTAYQIRMQERHGIKL